MRPYHPRITSGDATHRTGTFNPWPSFHTGFTLLMMRRYRAAEEALRQPQICRAPFRRQQERQRVGDWSRLLTHHAVRSMSRKGDFWDNAVAFWSTLKAELTELARFQTRLQACAAIAEYRELP